MNIKFPWLGPLGTKLGASILALALTAPAHANIIENGSFEFFDPAERVGNYGSANTWQVYTAIPGWTASQNIELWNSGQVQGQAAYDGNYLLELNAHPGNANGSFSISQTFDSVIGQDYELTFAGHRRYANQSEDFSVTVGDLAVTIEDQPAGQWNEYSYLFTATDWVSTLTFTSLDGGGDTTGNLLDDVSITAVPESSALLLLLSGLASLMLARRKR